MNSFDKFTEPTAFFFSEPETPENKHRLEIDRAEEEWHERNYQKKQGE